MEWLIPLGIVVVLLVAIGIYLWATYNSLVQLGVRVGAALELDGDVAPRLVDAPTWCRISSRR